MSREFWAQFTNACTHINDPGNLIEAFGGAKRAAWLVEGVGRCLWHLQNLMVDGPGQRMLRIVEDKTYQYFRINHSWGPAHASGGSWAQNVAGMRSIDRYLGRFKISEDFQSKPIYAHLNDPENLEAG